MQGNLDHVLEHSAPWPWWATFLVVLAAAQIALASYMLERGGYAPRRIVLRIVLAGLRFAAAAIVVLMLYGWVSRPYQTDPADLLILIDDSASMAHADAYDDGKLRAKLASRLKSQSLSGLSRINVARSLLLDDDLKPPLAAIEERYNVKLYFLGAAARDGAAAKESADGSLEKSIRDAAADQPASRLGQGLRDCLEAQRGRPPAAVVLFTDGIVTEGPSLVDAAEFARRRGVPLFIIGLGDTAPARDLWASDLVAEDILFVNDLATFEFRVGASGFQSQPVEARLTRTDSSEVLDRQTVNAPADGESATVVLRHRPTEIGEFEYVVEVGPLAKESREGNNRLQAPVSVRDETIRVLYVQEYPSGDFRYLKNLLSRGLKTTGDANSKSIELTTVLQDADERFTQIDENAASVFPVSKEELFSYNVVLFGDVNPARLGSAELENLALFVSEHGGGVAFIAGPRHTPLAFRDTPLTRLLPMDLSTASAPSPQAPLTSSFIPHLTRLGQTTAALELADSPQASRKIWGELPGMYWLLEAPDLKPGVRVLLEHPSLNGGAGERLPVLTLQYVGAGKVLFLASDDSWRWRYRAGDAYFGRFWVQWIRDLGRSSLVGARPVELTTDRREYLQGEPVRLRAKFRDDRQAPLAGGGVSVLLEREGSPGTTVVLTRQSDEQGVYAGEAADLAVGSWRALLAGGPPSADPAEARFSIQAPPGELARLEMNESDLKKAAEISRGKFYTAATAQRWRRDLPPGRSVRVRPLPLAPIWNSPLVAGLFVMLLVTEWLLRRRAGML